MENWGADCTRIVHLPRIAFYIGSLNPGGSERHVVRLIEALPALGFEVALVVNRKEGLLLQRVRELAVDPTEIPLSPTWQGRLRWLAQMTRYLRRGQFDILHAFNDISVLYAGLATVLARRPVLLCSQRHTWDFESKLKFISIARTYRHLARGILVNSQAAREIVLRECGVPSEERVRLVYNGVQVRPHRSPDGPRMARIALGLPPNELTVGMVASLSPLKQVEVLIHAAEKLSDLPIQFIIVGDGPQRPDLLRLIGEKGLSTRFWLIGTQHDPLAWMDAFDIGVLCSRSEGLPQVILEYMASGLPVVASAVGGVPELIVDGETGYLIPPGNPGVLAEAIRSLLMNADLRHRFGVSGQARASQHFSLDREAESCADAYRSWLN